MVTGSLSAYARARGRLAAQWRGLSASLPFGRVAALLRSRATSWQWGRATVRARGRADAVLSARAATQASSGEDVLPLGSRASLARCRSCALLHGSEAGRLDGLAGARPRSSEGLIPRSREDVR